MLFYHIFSDPPLLLLSPIHLMIEQSLGGKLHMLSLVCVARELFFCHGRVRVNSTGLIRAVQTEGQG
ncbi:unnamed protein product, partial [Staurois parvus]